MPLTIHLLGSHAMSSGTWVPTFRWPYNPAKCRLTYSSVNATLHPTFVISTGTVYTRYSLWCISWNYYCIFLHGPWAMTRYTVLKQLPRYSTLNVGAECSVKLLVSDQMASWPRHKSMNLQREHFWSYGTEIDTAQNFWSQSFKVHCTAHSHH